MGFPQITNPHAGYLLAGLLGFKAQKQGITMIMVLLMAGGM
jgi:hypothetical protein